MIIAVDGPTASGKGTLAKRIAEIYRMKRLDTGALYRAVALAMLDAGADPADANAAEAAAIALDAEHIDEDRIRTSSVGQAASIVSAHPKVRAALNELQVRFAAAPEGAVLDGRDIGTVVCPNADVKLFVTAALPIRVERRFQELRKRGEDIEFQELERQISARDARDRSRPVAPLRPALDAHLLDTSALSIEGAVEAARRIIDAVVQRPQA
jgi:cytidylate kinase